MADTRAEASVVADPGAQLKSFATQSTENASTYGEAGVSNAASSYKSARRIAFEGGESIRPMGSGADARDAAVTGAAQQSPLQAERTAHIADRGRSGVSDSYASSAGSRRSRAAAAGGHGLQMPTSNVAGHRAAAVQSPANHALRLISPSSRAVGADEMSGGRLGWRPVGLASSQTPGGSRHSASFQPSAPTSAGLPSEDATAPSVAPTDLSEGLDRLPLQASDGWDRFAATVAASDRQQTRGPELGPSLGDPAPLCRAAAEGTSNPVASASASATASASAAASPHSSSDAVPGAQQSVPGRGGTGGRWRGRRQGSGSETGGAQKEHSSAARRDAESRIVWLNVGGTVFATTKETLMRQPGSLLGAIASDDVSLPLDDAGRAFVDRDPALFSIVLNSLRDGAGECALPESRELLTRLWSEARFYGVAALEEEVESELARLASKPISRGLVLQLLHSASDGRLQLPATKLTGLVLSFLRLSDSILTGSDCSGADFSGSDLSRCQATFASFAGANMTSATLAEARLEQSVFRGANLVRAIVTGADLRGADFRDCDLRRANLTSASVKGALWLGATLEKAVVISVDLRASDMTGLILREANMEGSDLSGAVLRGADLSRANLWGCQGLETADLTGAILTGAILPPVLRAEGRLAGQAAAAAARSGPGGNAAGAGQRPPRHATGGAEVSGAAAATAATTVSRQVRAAGPADGQGGAVAAGQGGGAGRLSARVVSGRRLTGLEVAGEVGAGGRGERGGMGRAGRAVVAAPASRFVPGDSSSGSARGVGRWREQAVRRELGLPAHYLSGSVASADDPWPVPDSSTASSRRLSGAGFRDDDGDDTSMAWQGSGHGETGSQRQVGSVPQPGSFRR